MLRFAYPLPLAVIGTSALLGACAQILGGDEYSVAPKPSGVSGDGGTALATGASGSGGFAGTGAVVVDAQIPECRVASDCEPEACRISACVDGHCMPSLAPAGSDCTTPEGGKRCDATGACVVCRVDSVTNDAETDVDCGGPDCSPCPDLSACVTDADCTSNHCENSLCYPATCIDGQKNGDEGDVDCGGSCRALCAQGKTCMTEADCATGYCADGVCCGVPCGRCETCAPGTGACEPTPSNTDPQNECSGEANSCDGNGGCTQCSDSTPNGSETDVDCGGPDCAPCVTGSACKIDSDCVSCACEGYTCVSPRCDNGLQDGCETDVDCGGACPACGVGRACRVKADCTLYNCVEGVCVQ